MFNRHAHLKAAALAVFYTGMALGQTPNSNPWMNPSLPPAQATASPSSIALAAGFDPGLARLFGDMVGSSGAVSIGVHVVKGPGMNMLRTPRGGRNFAYLAEDPFLAGTMAAAEIRAMQSHGVIAMAKHFVGNEQELNRQTVSDVIDERTLAEIDLIPFEMSVKDGQELVQVYLGMPSSLEEPPKRLVGFQKLGLNPGRRRAWRSRSIQEQRIMRCPTGMQLLTIGLSRREPILSVSALRHATPFPQHLTNLEE